MQGKGGFGRAGWVTLSRLLEFSQTDTAVGHGRAEGLEESGGELSGVLWVVQW